MSGMHECEYLLLLLFLAPLYYIPEGKILKTKQVRPQRRLLSGESAVKETAFPRWRATYSRWNWYVDSLVSSVTCVIRRPTLYQLFHCLVVPLLFFNTLGSKDPKG